MAERGRTGGVLRGRINRDQEGAQEGDWLGDKRPRGSPQAAGHESEPEVRRALTSPHVTPLPRNS